MSRHQVAIFCAAVLGVAGCGPTISAGAGPAAGDPPGDRPGDRASGAWTSPRATPPVPDPSPPEGPTPDGGGTTPTPTRTVLLIPGTTITGDYFDTMAARLTSDGFSPVVYQPPDLFTDSLALGASRISSAVDAQLAVTGEARLHIVAECDGGVATRYYLQVLGGDARVDQVVTFVSAHHGTLESPVGQWVTGWQALTDITPGSGFLATLDGAPFPAGLKLTSIYSCHDELMVPYTTSIVDGATNVLFCNYQLGHFDGFWDQVVYDRILAALQGRGGQAPTSY